jgi:hypothetical protein
MRIPDRETEQIQAGVHGGGQAARDDELQQSLEIVLKDLGRIQVGLCIRRLALTRAASRT